jgi:hypothetical protein
MITFFWYLGILPGMRKTAIFIRSVVSLTNFYIWNIKLKKELIPVGTFMEGISGMINGLLKLSSTLREAKLSNNFYVRTAIRRRAFTTTAATMTTCHGEGNGEGSGAENGPLHSVLENCSNCLTLFVTRSFYWIEMAMVADEPNEVSVSFLKITLKQKSARTLEVSYF